MLAPVLIFQQRTTFGWDLMAFIQVIVVDNYFTGSKDNLKQWIGHPRFELIRHGRLSNTSYNNVLLNSLASCTRDFTNDLNMRLSLLNALSRYPSGIAFLIVVPHIP